MFLNYHISLYSKESLQEITFARAHKNAHCSIVYNNKREIKLKIHHEGNGFINYSAFPLQNTTE